MSFERTFKVGLDSKEFIFFLLKSNWKECQTNFKTINPDGEHKKKEFKKDKKH